MPGSRCLYRFCWFAGIGFALSTLAHVLALLGRDLGRIFPPIWLLHVGIFVVWFPAVMVMSLSQPRPRAHDLWQVATKHAPLWMRILCVLVCLYGIGNFMYTVDRSLPDSSPGVREDKAESVEHIDEPAGAPTQQKDPDASTTRSFSGHWMMFYLIGWTVLLSHLRKRRSERPVPPSLPPKWARS